MTRNIDEARTAKERDAELPQSQRSDEHVQGHWLLARLGKRVLRPGGQGLTRAMLSRIRIHGADVVELAPGLGRTATDILAAGPGTYTGVDNEPASVATVQKVIGSAGTVVLGEATATGLPDASADVIVGEAMLTMQGEKGKDAFVSEAMRVLRPGGTYAIHELGLAPADLPDDTKTRIRKDLAQTIRVNARPQTVPEWCDLLTAHGLVVEHVETAPMALLQTRRLLADEGLAGTLRFTKNLLTHPVARRRVTEMSRTFRKYRDYLIAVALVARVP